MGDPTPQRGKVVAYTQASQPRTQASTRTHIKITEKGREITSALRGQYKNQHMLAESACSVLSIIIFVIIITTERELDQDTCREGVEAAERERKKKHHCVCDDVCVSAVTQG